ncbi:MAG: class I SAM-dependent methyltransferase [Opitutaceae bacterium]|jgi:SAM-dependent methyltransferase
MHIVLDTPTGTRPIAPFRFNVRGWVWDGEDQSRIAAIEAWSGDVIVGFTETLVIRPDVSDALLLPAGSKTGFDFFADQPNADSSPEFDLHLCIRMRDGTRSAQYCQTRVKLLPWQKSSIQERGNDPAEKVSASPQSQKHQEPCERAVSKVLRIEEGLNNLHACPESLPPDHLQIRQVGSVWGPLFYSEGRVIMDQIVEAFREAGKALDKAATILDFGCGCGRVLWSFQDIPHVGEVWGCDIDAESIAWDRAHLGHIAQFYTNPVLPPTQFRDGYFDAIYTVSVFTHLPEEIQFAWLSELRRILKPGGVLVASLHGAHCWKNADPGIKSEMETRGFAYQTSNLTEGLPDFYMLAFHSEAYVRTRWSSFFQFVALKEKFIHGLHDAAIMRRRDD